jgi:multiple antibiotic resistance protein
MPRRNFMIEVIKSLLLILSALIPIVDPLGGSPIFLALTREYSPEARKALSRQIAIYSFYLLIGSYLLGTPILAFFGISLPAVQIAGGLIVISAGWTMLNRREDEKLSEVNTHVQTQDVYPQAFYPLTLPLTVGPGSISVAITLGANAAHHGVSASAIVAALIGSLVVAITIYLCYAFADRLGQMLGARAMNVIMRLTSFLLVCIGVQIVWNGVSALMASRPMPVQ